MKKVTRLERIKRDFSYLMGVYDNNLSKKEKDYEEFVKLIINEFNFKKFIRDFDRSYERVILPVRNRIALSKNKKFPSNSEPILKILIYELSVNRLFVDMMSHLSITGLHNYLSMKDGDIKELIKQKMLSALKRLEYAFPNMTSYNLFSTEILIQIFSEKKIDRIIEKIKNIKIGNPNEQELFKLVKEEYDILTKKDALRKIKIKELFRLVNEKYSLVDPNEITDDKFTKSVLYNRYKQFLLRERKKEKKYSNNSVVSD